MSGVMPNIHLLSCDAGWERWSPAARVRARGHLLASVSDRHRGLPVQCDASPSSFGEALAQGGRPDSRLIRLKVWGVSISPTEAVYCAMLRCESKDLFLPFQETRQRPIENVTCPAPAAMPPFGNKHLLKFMRCPSNPLGALKACGRRPSQPKESRVFMRPGVRKAGGFFGFFFWRGHWRDDDANPTWGLVCMGYNQGKAEEAGRG